MSNVVTTRFARGLLLAGLALPMAALFPAAETFSAKAQAPAAQSDAGGAEAPGNQPADQADSATLAQFKATLAQYGQFIQHERYGEVWIPTVTPQGWHPYPSCQWVYVKDIGWYFKDDTEWGAIVHHHGRWTQDIKHGWMWVPDADWSPGWVVWRMSDRWVGWAPMPPEIDSAIVGTEAFDNDKLWTFMAAEKFRSGCGDTLLMSQVGGLTQYASLFELPAGNLVSLVVAPRWKIKVIRRIVIVPRPCRPPPDRPRDPPLTHVPPKRPPQDPPRAEVPPKRPLPQPPLTYVPPQPPLQQLPPTSFQPDRGKLPIDTARPRPPRGHADGRRPHRPGVKKERRPQPPTARNRQPPMAKVQANRQNVASLQRTGPRLSRPSPGHRSPRRR